MVKRMDPTGPAHGQHRVLRGGSWRYGPGLCRAAYRRYALPDGRDCDAGFRARPGIAFRDRPRRVDTL